MYVCSISPEKLSSQHADTDDMKEKFRNDPEYYLRYCKAVESELNVRFKFLLNDTPDAAAAKEVCHMYALPVQD